MAYLGAWILSSGISFGICILPPNDIPRRTGGFTFNWNEHDSMWPPNVSGNFLIDDAWLMFVGNYVNSAGDFGIKTKNETYQFQPLWKWRNTLNILISTEYSTWFLNNSWKFLCEINSIHCMPIAISIQCTTQARRICMSDSKRTRKLSTFSIKMSSCCIETTQKRNKIQWKSNQWRTILLNLEWPL